MYLSRIDSWYLRVAQKSWRLYRRMIGEISLHSGYGRLVIPVRNRIGHQWADWGAGDEARVKLVRQLQQLTRGAVVDVGANVGLYCAAVLLADRQIRYVGVEPNLICAEYVHQLIQLNGAARTAQVLPVGFSETAATASFYLAGESDVSATMLPVFRPLTTDSVRETIAVLRGDDALRGLELDGVSLIKVDVEGAELDVLHGLSETLASCRPALVVEVLPHAHNSNLPRESIEYRRRRAGELTTFLSGLGYGGLHMTGGALRPVSTLERGDDQNWRESDFLCVPMERWSAFAHVLGFPEQAIPLSAGLRHSRT